MKHLILMPLILMLSGCAAMVQPSRAEFERADFGAPPANPREIVMGYINSAFKDPYSIRDLEIGTPYRASETAPPLLGGQTVYGYKIPFSVNGRNSYGAYTGKEAFTLFTRDGKIIPGAAGIRD